MFDLGYQGTGTSIQTGLLNPLAFSCFSIYLDDLFIPDFQGTGACIVVGILEVLVSGQFSPSTPPHSRRSVLVVLITVSSRLEVT